MNRKYYNMYGSLLVSSLLLLASASCSTEKKKGKIMNENEYMEGSYAYDLAFLQKHTDPIVLEDESGNSALIVVPQWQGRVMTSTARGAEGTSFGWINYELIGSGRVEEHMNAFGGEDRLWLGPEGGQFSLYFKGGASFDFENWFVPSAIDTEVFDIVAQEQSLVRFRKEMKLPNYSGFEFHMLIERSISLLSSEEISDLLDVAIPQQLNYVAYTGTNVIYNKGEIGWTRETGMPSIWILDMFSPSPGVTIVIPYREGPQEELGRTVTDDYFGKVPPDRLIIEEGIIYLKADGKYRSKIGISPLRALPLAASYDELTKTLTIASFSLHEGVTDYVNSRWEIQEEPFSGDAVNSYNDGPLEDGSQMGPFYELESSSPAANLAPGESLEHIHSVIHFQGEEEYLSLITEQVLGISINKIKSIFK